MNKTSFLSTAMFKTICFIVVLFATATSFAQRSNILTVTGKVTAHRTNEALHGVNIIEKGTQNKTVTDINGNFSIRVERGKTLVFSLTGYATQEITARNANLNVSLMPSEHTVEVVEITTREDRRNIRTREEIAVPSVAVAMRPPYLYPPSLHPSYFDMQDNETYSEFSENRFREAKTEPLSTFSLDVDVASYGNVRRMINMGQKPPKDAVRVEEFINYFSYDYPNPTAAHPVSVVTETQPCPWNREHLLVRIGVKAKEIPSENLPPSNFVFLIDVSGSMFTPNRLPLVKSSLKLLTNNLREQDRVSIVVYAGNAGEVLPSTSGADRQKIFDALEALEAGGSTAGGAGIQLAYQVAQRNFIEGGNNRVILCTDGDFNVGVSSERALENLIEEKRRTGVYLTILGYGMGNYKDSKLQTLSQKGNGNHAYIDNLQEANRVLVQEFGSTMYAVARDVKMQVEFNPAYVNAWRLVGYETRLLNREDFNDDTVDAGELGAGHTVTTFYEIIPAVAMFGQLLRNSDFKGTSTYDDVITLARKGFGEDKNGYRREFVRLAETMKQLDK